MAAATMSQTQEATMQEREVNPLQHVPDLPIPISLVAGRYLVFDIDVALYIRRAHNVCGYNIGTLPLIPSQNSFLGLPVILMPEEAQLLVDDGIGYILDDARAHDRIVYNRNHAQAAAYCTDLQRQVKAFQDAKARDQEENKRRALGKQRGQSRTESGSENAATAPDLLIFDDAEATPNQSIPSAHFVTPTSSRTLLSPDEPKSSQLTSLLPNVSSAYPLFRHLHSRGYFMTPGLRFGCQYTTYPGDPLRFHSHFLTADFGWNDGINLMDIVGGGRLGTGVKKGFLIGGDGGASSDGGGQQKRDNVRTFSIEWAVM